MTMVAVTTRWGLPVPLQMPSSSWTTVWWWRSDLRPKQIFTAASRPTAAVPVPVLT